MKLQLLTSILLFPLILAFVQILLPRNSIIWKIFNVGGSIAFLILNCLQLTQITNLIDHNVFEPSAPKILLHVWEFMPGITMAFEANFLSVIFMIFVAFLWIMNSLYAFAYLEMKYPQKDSRDFFFFIALSIFATTIAAFSANLITMFLGYELLTLSTLPLIIYSGLSNAKKSANLYFTTLMFASIFFLLPTVIVLYSENPSTFWQTSLPFFAIFGVAKCALFPFHFWLPRAMVAPTPVSAMFHAVAVVKIGILCVLKIVFFHSNLHLNVQDSAYILHYIAGFSALYASVMAMRKVNLKEILAYSTITQLSYLIMTICLWDKQAVFAVMMHVVSHGFGKITLFMAAGAIAAKTQIYELSTIYGIGRKMPVTMLCFTLCSLSIIGIPPLAGGLSKFLLMMYNERSTFGIAVLIIGTVLNTYYLSRVVFYAWDRNAQIEGKIDEAPRLMVVPMLICTFITIVLGIFGFVLFSQERLINLFNF